MPRVCILGVAVVSTWLVSGPWPAEAKAPAVPGLAAQSEQAPGFLGEGWLVARGKDGTPFVEERGGYLRITGKDSNLRRDRSLLDASGFRRLFPGDLVLPLRFQADPDTGREWVLCRVYGWRADVSIPSSKIEVIDPGLLVVRFTGSHVDRIYTPMDRKLSFAEGDIAVLTNRQPPNLEECVIEIPLQLPAPGLGWLVARGTEGTYATMAKEKGAAEVLVESINVRATPDPAAGILMPLGKGSGLPVTGRSLERDGRTWIEVFVPERVDVRVAASTSWSAPRYADKFVQEENRGAAAYIPRDHPFAGNKEFSSLLHAWTLGPSLLGICDAVERQDAEGVRFRFRLRPTLDYRDRTHGTIGVLNNVPDIEQCELIWNHRGRPVPLRKGDSVRLVIDGRTGRILCVYSSGWEITKFKKGVDGLVEVLVDEGAGTQEAWIIPDKLGMVMEWPDYHIWMYEDFGVVINTGMDGAGDAYEASRLQSELWGEGKRFSNEVEFFDLDPRIRRGGWRPREELEDYGRSLIQPKQQTHEPG